MTDGIVRPPVSLRDVAALAGVSLSTASRALLGQVGVSEGTKRRVHDAADTIGYVKDVRAQALRSHRSPTVGVYVRSIRLSYYGELIAELQRGLTEFGLNATVSTSWGGDDDDGVSALNALVGTRPLGLIVASGRMPLSVIEHHARTLPIVVVGQAIDSAVVGSVADDGGGTDELAGLLYEQGHRSIGVFDIPDDRSRSLGYRTQRIRHALGSRGVKRVDIPLDPVLDRGDEAALLAAAERVTAIMCANDPLLITTMEVLDDAGIRVPEDMSLTGYDGIGQLASPVLGLTSWRQPTDRIARAAVAQIHAMIKDGLPPSNEVLRGELLPGRTLGTPRTTVPPSKPRSREGAKGSAGR